jgi:predicted MFS family arabinose efflux permease
LSVGISFSVLALIPFGLIRSPYSISSEDRLEINREIVKKIRGPFFRLALPYFLVGAGAGMIIPFLNLFFRDRFGQSPQEIGFLYGMVNLTMFIGVMAGPVLVRKCGMVRTLAYTQLLSIPFMLVLAFSYNFPLVIFAFLMRGGLMNMGQPIGTNFAMEMVPEAYHGLLNAFLNFAWMLSWMVATQVGGMVIERYGYTASLLVAVGMYIISSVLYYLFFRQAERFTPDGVMISGDYRTLG